MKNVHYTTRLFAHKHTLCLAGCLWSMQVGGQHRPTGSSEHTECAVGGRKVRRASDTPTLLFLLLCLFFSHSVTCHLRCMRQCACWCKVKISKAQCRRDGETQQKVFQRASTYILKSSRSGRMLVIGVSWIILCVCLCLTLLHVISLSQHSGGPASGSVECRSGRRWAKGLLWHSEMHVFPSAVAHQIPWTVDYSLFLEAE